MPWCPKCKSEYKDGIHLCAECKVPLVDELPSEEECEVSEEMQEAMIRIMSQMQNQETQEEEQEPVEIVKVYQDKNSKAEDFKSSAYTLLFVGILGLVALILIELGVLPFTLVAPGKYITYGVMGGLFVIFIIMGISSLKSSKKYMLEAKSEDELTDKIKNWVMTNVSKDMIVEKAGLDEITPEEMKYFKYFEILKESIREQFGVLDASYLESISEELYGKLFEEN